MSLILSIETATKVCSVSLAKDGVERVTLSETSEKYSHLERLNTLIQEVCNQGKIELKDLDAVAVSEGPGSYTGLRIGVSTAKGICYALDLPLIAVNSLKAVAQLYKGDADLICPMFDARRMEVYSAIYANNGLEEISQTEAVVVDGDSYLSFLENKKVAFLGPGAEKCQDSIGHQNAYFDLETEVSAAGMNPLAYEKFKQSEFVSTAYFEPFYLKDFIAGTPKKLF